MRSFARGYSIAGGAAGVVVLVYLRLLAQPPEVHFEELVRGSSELEDVGGGPRCVGHRVDPLGCDWRLVPLSALDCMSASGPSGRA